MRLILATLLLSLLSACSTTRIAYDNADLYLRWRIGTFLDVEGAQSDELDERIEDFMVWHRAHALPQYVEILEDAARRLERGLTQQDAVWAHDTFLAQARASLIAGTERLAPLLDRLSGEQLKYLERGIASDNRRFAREQLRGSAAERRERRAVRVVERMEDWMGRLTLAQVERIRLFSERAPLTSDLRQRDRQRLQADVVAILRARQAQKRLAERIAYWQTGQDPALAAANDAFRSEANALTVDLDRLMTAEQRARAVGQMRRLAQELRAIAARRARVS